MSTKKKQPKTETRKNAKIVGVNVGISLYADNVHVVDYLPLHTLVDLVGYENGFAKIKINNMVGYVPTYYISKL